VPASRSPIRDADDINRVIDAFADAKPGGLIVLPSVPAVKHHDLIFVAASRHRFPVVYPYRSFALSGGLVSYGVDTLDMYRCAATYVDRILKGEKPAELPVQFASRFEFVINLKAAKTIGLTVPNSELLNATDVVE
jgi:putative ABC transport system substrate-binding protein